MLLTYLVFRVSRVRPEPEHILCSEKVCGLIWCQALLGGGAIQAGGFLRFVPDPTQG